MKRLFLVLIVFAVMACSKENVIPEKNEYAGDPVSITDVTLMETKERGITNK